MRFSRAASGRFLNIPSVLSKVGTRSSTDSAETNRDLVLAAFETSYEPIARYIALRIGDRSEAEDLASEVFVRALRKSGTFIQNGKPIEAWLFKIAHNLLVDHLRKKGRHMPAVSLDSIADVPTSDDSVEHILRLDDRASLKAAMSCLTDAERQVIALRFGGEMSPQEIGTALGKSSGAVRWLQHSAVEKLRRAMTKADDAGQETGR